MRSHKVCLLLKLHCVCEKEKERNVVFLDQCVW